MAEQLGRFALLNRIGSGGMAEVFLARGPAGMCVVKRMHARISEDPDLVRMFLDEASLAAQLSHPGIARVFDLGESGGSYYFAMEYVPGFDLYTILQENAARKLFMAPEVAARLAADLAAALHHAHEAVGARGQKLGIIHRDVSPQNILISTLGQVKLIDFGVARASQKMHQTRAGLVKGKAAYMAPEQVVAAQIDRRVDVYALGLVLFEMLTNHRAIVGEQEMEIILNARAGKLNELTEFRHDVPEALRAVMMRCLAFKADGRPATADAVRAELEAWLASAGKKVGRAELSALLKVVPADPNHAIEESVTPSGKHKKVLASALGGKASRISDSTLRPKAPALEKPGDETFRANRRVSAEFYMGQFKEDGSRAEASTDVERKGLGSGVGQVAPAKLLGPVPGSQEDGPTVAGEPPRQEKSQKVISGPITLRSSDHELIAQAHEAGKAMARTERNPPVRARPTATEGEKVEEAEPSGEHATRPPEVEQAVSDATVIPRRGQEPVSDATLVPRRGKEPLDSEALVLPRSKTPMVAVALGALGLLAALAWFFLQRP